MEHPQNELFISDNTLITKKDGKKLRYYQLRNDFIALLQREPESFLLGEKFQEDLPDIIVRFLGRKNILAWGEQVAGPKKEIFDKLLEEFSNPKKILERNEPPLNEDKIVKKSAPPRNLPLFENLE